MMDRHRHHRAQSGREVSLPCEVAVALSYNGSTQAVMMATPADLLDFAYGFSLTEGIASRAEIDSVTVQDTDLGIDLQIWLKPDAEGRLAGRRRSMAGPVGCGLCGIDSLEQAVRAPRQVPPSDLHLTPAMITQAVRDMGAHQPLHDLTRATHAAAYWVPGQGCVALREDVGRHNALDKLAGAVVAGGFAPGVVVITSRVSIDMVQKCAALGAPVLIAVAAPTAAAVAMADLAGITLVALARGDRFEVFSQPDRISTKDISDVA
ncbi:MAG: formate dehydrogenase accessory sulfurtransferase FdhD [Pseudomonadota bacterium]